jgi:hypothetical protein
VKDLSGNYKALGKTLDFSFADRVKNEISKEKLGKGSHLIYIESQEVLFNGEISTVTYFKDITFGILYEQIKA